MINQSDGTQWWNKVVQQSEDTPLWQIYDKNPCQKVMPESDDTTCYIKVMKQSFDLK